MQITRLYTGEDGESHFEEIDVSLSSAGKIGKLSAPLPATSIIFRETDGGYDYDWHNAPQRQYILILDGAVDIEIGDGTVRRFGSGDILLAEDTHGRGHISRAVDGQSRRSVFVTLESIT
jgi:hypothetical protein